MDLSPFRDIGLDDASFAKLVRDHEQRRRPALDKLWAYYRNPVIGGGGCIDEFAAGAAGGAAAGPGPTRGAMQAQAMGLPERLRRPASAGGPGEIVIENDIAWRVDALVDVVFGKPVRIESMSSDAALAQRIERTLEIVWEASGGLGLMQDLALLGGVYGYADLMVRCDELLFGEAGDGARRLAKRSGDNADAEAAARAAAEGVRLEPISPARGVPIVDPADYRVLLGYAVRSSLPAQGGGGGDEASGREVVEVVSRTHRAVYQGGELRWSGEHGLPGVPVVHMQNVGRPFSYAGVSDVEPLMGLQDELNTRLSDRAHRVTMQSFRMYVAKGIEGMGEIPVRPGQVWSTDNTDAEVQAFGGDVYSPSEDEHITQVREALDKASGVSPVVLGLLRAKIGHLSSENALRVTLMGVLAKAARKRMNYGRGIVAASRMVLAALHDAGVLKTDEADRALRIRWPDPLPVDDGDRLATALKKVELGVPRERVLEELGYGATDGGVS